MSYGRTVIGRTRNAGHTDAWIAAVGLVISAAILPVATNVLSGLVPAAVRPYLWISVPVTVVLTGVLILIGRRTGRPAEAAAASIQHTASIQHNVTFGGTSYAVQNGTLHAAPPGQEPTRDD